MHGEIIIPFKAPPTPPPPPPVPPALSASGSTDTRAGAFVAMTNSSSSWVVDVDTILNNLKDGKEQFLRSKSWSSQYIYRVPEWFRNLNKGGAYEPQVVSLGPLHHNNVDLKERMKVHKYRALVVLVSRSGKPLVDFIAAVTEVADKLEEAYGHDLDVKWRGENNRERFVEMMVMDGCFLLELLAIQDDCDKPDPIHSGYYDTHDPVFTRRSMWPVIRSDMLALENQLPLLLLQKLMCVQESKTTAEGIAEVDKIINRRVLKFLRAPLHQDAASKERNDDLLEKVIDNMKLGLHPLELYHQSVIYTVPQSQSHRGSKLSEYQEDIMPSAVEMHEAGIKFRTSTTNSLIDVHFTDTMFRLLSVLTMPQVTVDDSTEYLFLNMMAFERLHCHVDTHVTAYVIFMDNLIESARDVAMLCSKGVLKNMLGSNEELARLFNGTLSRGALMEKYSEDKYAQAQPQKGSSSTVQSKVKNHCKKVSYKWRAILARTYFGNPWTFISLVAAIILLAATLVQTFYAIVPYNKPTHLNL